MDITKMKLNECRKKILEVYLELLQEAITSTCASVDNEHMKNAVNRFFETFTAKSKEMPLTELVQYFFGSPRNISREGTVSQFPLPSYAYTHDAERDIYELAKEVAFTYDDYTRLRILIQTIFGKWRMLKQMATDGVETSDLH